MAGDFESGTNEENNGDMREEGEGRRVDLSGPCPIWEEKKAAQSIGRLGICYRSQLPMMLKSKRIAGFLAGHATN